MVMLWIDDRVVCRRFGLALLFVMIGLLSANAGAQRYENCEKYLRGTTDYKYCEVKNLGRQLDERADREAREKSIRDEAIFREKQLQLQEQQLEALRQIKLQKDAGNTEATRTNRDVEIEDIESFRLLKARAARGEVEAQSQVGQVLAGHCRRAGCEFQLIATNEVEAVMWLRLAARNGDWDAQGRLGTMYQNGSGLAKDYVRAYMWHTIQLAGTAPKNCSNCREFAIEWLVELEKKMTSNQVAEAASMARNCLRHKLLDCD